MNRRPPILTRTGTPFPYTPLCRSLPGHAGDAALATFLGAGLGAGGRIVELDRVRDGRSETGELASVPMWMLDCTQAWRSEEHTSELQSLMRISYAVFGLKKKKYSINDETESETDGTTIGKRH